MRVRLFALLLLSFGSLTVAAGDQVQSALPVGMGIATGQQALSPDEFGSADSWTVVPLSRFVPNSSTVKYVSQSPGAYWALSAESIDEFFRAPVDLPPGTEVLEVCAFLLDNDPSHQAGFAVFLAEMGDELGPPVSIAAPGGPVATGIAETPGYVRLCTTPPSPLLIRGVGDVDGNGRSSWVAYEIAVQLQYSPTGQIGLGGASIRWRRTVSPAPVSASFTDVPPSNPLFRFVEALKASGISGGCTPTKFCPNDPVTRGQMAVFLSVALGLHWGF